MNIRGRRRRVRRATLGLLLSVTVLTAPLAPFAFIGNSGGAAFASQSAVIAHSEDGVVLRDAPAYGGNILSTLPDGTSVTLRTDVLDTVNDPDGETRWWPVSSPDGEGWVAGFYLEIDGWDQSAVGEPTDADSTADAPATENTGAGGETSHAGDRQWTDTAAALVANAVAEINDPDGVNMRSAPGLSGSEVTTLGYQTVVDLRLDVLDTMYADGQRWWPVSVDGEQGWVSGDFLSPADAALASGLGDQSSDAGAGDQTGDLVNFSANQYVEVATGDGDGVNVRADGAPDAERVGSFPDSDVVQVMDGPTTDPLGNPWYLATDGNITGYVIGRYLKNANQLPDPNGNRQKAADIAQSVADNTPKAGVATGSFEYPVDNFTLTQGYGCSPYWMEPWNSSLGCNFHNGVDLADPQGTPIHAADGGVVEQAGWCDCGLGYYVKIDHENGFKTVYGHMAEVPWVSVGEPVTKGETIGPVGSTGNSTGPHVHFIIEYQGVTYDPFWYLP